MTSQFPDDAGRGEALALLQERLFGPILKADVSDQLKLNARYVRMRLDQRALEDFLPYLRLAANGDTGLAAQAAAEGLQHVQPAIAALVAWTTARLRQR